MLENRTATADLPAAQRSRVTNGKTLFAEGGDMRSPWARRLRDVLGLHLSDLGGAEAVSEAERSIARRASVLTVELERIEARFAVDKGEPGDLDLYQRTAGSLRRLLESVGLQRRARDVGPTLSELIREDALDQEREQREAAARAAADDQREGDSPDDETLAGESLDGGAVPPGGDE
jgi:hypothetical protein